MKAEQHLPTCVKLSEPPRKSTYGLHVLLLGLGSRDAQQRTLDVGGEIKHEGT